jgi:excinuclease ABC subunit C
MQREDISRYDIPDTPGVYFFLGPKRGGAGRDGKDILYIGKATSLHDRVRSYFAKDLGEARSPAIVAMVGKADGLKWQECGSVLEALILEAALIKKHQPPYNVDEKDDKSWNYVVVTKEDFPRVLIVRGRELHDPVFLKTKNYQLKTVFGPFPHGGQLKEALKLVRKIFPFRDICMPASENTPQNRKASPYGFKQCFNAQIGLWVVKMNWTLGNQLRSFRTM